MSRSRKKNPISGITTSRSEKDEKRIINRALRRKTRTMLKEIDDPDGDFHLPSNPDEYMNVWTMSKDGKKRHDKVEAPKCDVCRDRVTCLTDETYKEYKCLPWWRYNSWKKVSRK